MAATISSQVLRSLYTHSPVRRLANRLAECLVVPAHQRVVQNPLNHLALSKSGQRVLAYLERQHPGAYARLKHLYGADVYRSAYTGTTQAGEKLQGVGRFFVENAQTMAPMLERFDDMAMMVLRLLGLG